MGDTALRVRTDSITDVMSREAFGALLTSLQGLKGLSLPCALHTASHSMIRNASPREITAPPEHHHGNAKRKLTRGPTDRQMHRAGALHPSAHEQGWIHTSPGTSALLCQP